MRWRVRGVLSVRRWLTYTSSVSSSEENWTKRRSVLHGQHFVYHCTVIDFLMAKLKASMLYQMYLLFLILLAHCVIHDPSTCCVQWLFLVCAGQAVPVSVGG